MCHYVFMFRFVFRPCFRNAPFPEIKKKVNKIINIGGMEIFFRHAFKNPDLIDYLKKSSKYVYNTFLGVQNGMSVTR